MELARIIVLGISLHYIVSLCYDVFLCYCFWLRYDVISCYCVSLLHDVILCNGTHVIVLFYVIVLTHAMV